MPNVAELTTKHVTVTVVWAGRLYLNAYPSLISARTTWHWPSRNRYRSRLAFPPAAR